MKTKKQTVFTKNWRVLVHEFKWKPKKGLYRQSKSICSRNHVKTKTSSMHHPALRCRPWLNHWGDAVKLLGGIYPSIPPWVSAPLIVLSWKQPVIGVHIRPGGPDTFNSKSCLMSITLTVAFFFKSILLHKNWRGGGELLLKTVQWIVTPTNQVIARAGLTLSWAPGQWWP